MAALRRRSAFIEHSTALSNRNSALITAPRRGRTTEGFTSSSNLTIISASGTGTDSTFSTMATRTDIPGTGRVIDKYVFQPAGRKIEAFIGGIVRRISTRKVRRRESAALLAEELATSSAQGDVAPPYTTRRGRRPLPQIPESSVAAHPTVTPWLAQSSAFSTFNEHSERSYNGSERPYSLVPTVSTVPSPQSYYHRQDNDNTSIPAPILNITSFQPFSYHRQDDNNMFIPSPMIDAQPSAPTVVDTSAGGQWQNEAPLSSLTVIVAPPAYDVMDSPPVPQIVIHSVPAPGVSSPMNEPTLSSSSSSSTRKLMTFCMNDEHVYVPTEPDYDKALTLAQSFFPALASTSRESIAFSFVTVVNNHTEDESPAPTRMVRVAPAVWAHLCQRREDREIVHITVMPSPHPHSNFDLSLGGTRDPKNSLASTRNSQSSTHVTVKLMMFAYEGELVFVPSAPDYELAVTTALTAFPALAHLGREEIVFSLRTRLLGGPTKSIRVPREAWSCLSPTLPDCEIIEISLRSHLDRPLLNPHLAESSTYLHRDFSSPYDTSRDIFASDADDLCGSGLWRQPPEKELEPFVDGKRLDLSMNTGGIKESSARRGPYTSQVPNFPILPELPTVETSKPIFKWARGDLIGIGTYGRVYLAINSTTGEMIAAKQVELPKTDADHDDGRQARVKALRLECETLKDLEHPHIVQYLGFEETPDVLSIFMEYVPGDSVAGCLRKHGKFEDRITRSFTDQILSGLEYLHQNNIIHRDLKASNILVYPSGVCKISDFSISKRTGDINENAVHTSMQGSVFWMAPDVVQAARKGESHGYNGKVDIWSLGCVVLEMWTGRRPWPDADAFGVIFQLITKSAAPPVPPDVTLSPEADDFRQKCFAIRPDERPSASELRLHRYLTLSPNWTFQGFT